MTISAKQKMYDPRIEERLENRESLLKLWERAQAIRSWIGNERSQKQQDFLSCWAARVQALFTADFCFVILGKNLQFILALFQNQLVNFLRP